MAPSDNIPQINSASVGLFGTCGPSTGRAPFIDKLEKLKISVFNPQLPEGTWRPDLANQYIQEELYHLEHCPVVVFAITDETAGFVSLAEIGFAVAQLSENHRRGLHQTLLVYIDPEQPLASLGAAISRESHKVRQLLTHKLNRSFAHGKTLHIASSLDELLSLTLTHAASLRQG